jgi:hypothetical protein
MTRTASVYETVFHSDRSNRNCSQREALHRMNQNSRTFKQVPSQGDAVLIGLLGIGKTLEVARNAATNLLPADNEKREISTTWQKSDHMTDLKALAADALNVGKIHTARVATAPNALAPPPLSEDSIARRLNRLNYNIIQGSD